jgi:hypothetical protein
MRVTLDPGKRVKTLLERGLDFEDASLVFEGTTVEVVDTRRNYGEPRIIRYGLLSGRLVVVGYTPLAERIAALNAVADAVYTRWAEGLAR